jgi:tetratricopeptide (TPR) repeat protein
MKNKTTRKTYWLPFLSTVILLCLLLSGASVREIHGAETKENPPSSTFKGNPRILDGINLIYDRRFEDAETLFRKMTTDAPRDPSGYFYLAMITWSKLAAGFWTPETVKEYKKRIDRAIEVAQARVDNKGANSYDFFYLGGALGFKGRFELMKGNMFASFLLASDAIKALKTCQEMAPDDKDVLLGIGTFDYYTAKLSGVLKFLTYFLLHRGDIKEGLRKLNEAALHATYSSTEAKSVLLYIELFSEQNFPHALALATDLSNRYADNPRYKTLEGVCFIRMDKDRQYKEVLRDLLTRSREAPSSATAAIWKNRARYLESINDLYDGRYAEARIVLEEILKHPDPEHDPTMIAWPLIKLGMSYDLAGDRDRALGYYNQVMEMENPAGAQFVADKLLEDPIEPKDPFIGY